MDNFFQNSIAAIIFYVIIMLALVIWVDRAKPSKEVFPGNPNWKYLLYFLGIKNWKNEVKPDVIPMLEGYFFRYNFMTIFLGICLIGYLLFSVFAVSLGIYKAIGVF